MLLPENRIRRGNSFKNNQEHEAKGNRNKMRLLSISELRGQRRYDNRLFSIFKFRFASNRQQFL